MIRFGTFEADLRAGELRKQGRKIKLQEKPFLLLSILLERPGEVVNREELQKRLWPEDTFVDFTQGLNTAAAKLRAALGDPADNPRFVETVRRRGYRFVAPVEQEEREETTKEPLGQQSREPPEPVSIGGRSRRNYFVLIALVVALSSVLITVILMNRKPSGQGRESSRLDSLAVLPLDNLMDDPEQDYFVDGMTDLLIANLAQISALRVTSRTSTVHYKNARKTLPVIAQELGVAAIVEGSVLRSGDRVRITVQLVDAASDRHLWAESYEREFGDVLTLQNELAQAISREVHVVLTQQERERLAGARPVNPDAYEAYLKGRYFWNKRTEAGLRRAVEYFEQAVQEDPQLAIAYVGLADAYLMMRRMPAEDRIQKANPAIMKALELDETIAEAHASIGQMKAYLEYDWAEAEQAFKRAVALSPSYATAHHWYGLYLTLMGRPDASYAEMKRALELDPLSIIIRVDLGATFVLAGELDRAIEECLEGLEMDPHFAAGHYWLGRAYIRKGMYPESIAALQTALDLDQAATRSEAVLGFAYAASGNLREAQTRLDKFMKLSSEGQKVSAEIALIYLGMGESEQAIDWLERAYQDHHEVMLHLKRDPLFDGLRSEPRFQDLVRRLNFPS